jgi:Flp pilus assembly protein TadG
MRNKKGQVLIELALALPLLFAVMFMLIDLGRLVYARNMTTNAAYMGARVAVVARQLSAVGPTSISIGGEPATTISNALGNVTDTNITYQIALLNNGTAITGAGVQAVPGNQVQVTVSRPNYRLLTPVNQMMALVTGSSTSQSSTVPITSTATMAYE